MSRLWMAMIGLVGVALVAAIAVLFLREQPASMPKASPAANIPAIPGSGDFNGRTALYTCGMHPEVVKHEPGSCPICGMDLVPVRDAARESADAGTSPGGGAVRVSRSFLQNFAVRTAEVRRGPLTITTRAIGVLAHDEAKLVSVNTKFAGWIEAARVHNVGETVARGDVLFEMYSPEVVTTQREYLAAAGYVERLRDGGAYREAVERAESLLAAARERLRNWDISKEQIDALDRLETAPRTVRILAPASGIVVDKSGDSLEGMRVSPGQTVLKIADHYTLWAKADFDEEFLPHVREGSPVTVSVDAFPERRWEGRILFFRSAVNPETRALTAFVEVDNPDLALRPMMDVTVSAHLVETDDAILVPVESVLHSGERALVVVARDDGLFEPRAVALGASAGDLQRVTAGIHPGERVVVSSQFLIDSESNLKAAVAQLLGGESADGGLPGKAGGAAALPHRH